MSSCLFARLCEVMTLLRQKAAKVRQKALSDTVGTRFGAEIGLCTAPKCVFFEFLVGDFTANR